MLAYRTTWIVKEGHMREALEAISAEIERVREDVVTRVYTPDISPNVLVFQITFEDEAAHPAFWDATIGTHHKGRRSGQSGVR